MSKRRRNKIPEGLFKADIETLSHEGRGVAHIEGKIVFIENALPGEQVEFKYVSKRAKFDQGVAENIITANEQRIEPECKFFGYCGGCSLQHMKPDAQLRHKQSVLLEQFTHLGNVEAESILPPLEGPSFGYRHKARLAVKHVIKKEKVLVGFREKRSPFVADITECKVLHPNVGLKFTALQQLIESLSNYNQIPQIEAAVSDTGTALVLRHLADFTDEDIAKLNIFEDEHQLKMFLQPGGYDSVHRLKKNDEGTLSYKLDDHDITIYFKPVDFTQINVEINQKMLNLAIELLEPNTDENILDLFCGVGNFTLPLARKAKSVVGIEGDKGLVERAKNNAARNKINNVEFFAADLAELDRSNEFMKGSYDKILLDPARTGAKEIIEALNTKNVKRIVYVSCNPATLARDAGILVNEKGFKLTKAGIMDMFPHTTHVESIAVFNKE
ncbi:MAG: 23S rRNA (uracil(1939)-C(5))-methyltransferase RlmD [marine bacterium B5-7]|nr:MAG: 23S rRNA (uracil(1939)-C(5))-methyltransferase RlmD [marine bacterium B5-7]